MATLRRFIWVPKKPTRAPGARDFEPGYIDSVTPPQQPGGAAWAGPKVRHGGPKSRFVLDPETLGRPLTLNRPAIWLRPHGSSRPKCRPPGSVTRQPPGWFR